MLRNTKDRVPSVKAAIDPLVYGQAALIDSAAALVTATAALHALDPVHIGPMLARTGAPVLRCGEPDFAGLARIVIGQQVSTTSADAIFGRLAAAVAPLSHATLLSTSEATLKTAGLSMAKIRTLRAVADAVESGALDFAALADLPAEAAHRMLVSIKGIGPWTADVYLLFGLGHPDALPAGDIALQEGAKLALDLPVRPTPAELVALAEGWRPYRGVAAYVLWAFYRVARGRSGIVLEAAAVGAPSHA